MPKASSPSGLMSVSATPARPSAPTQHAVSSPAQSAPAPDGSGIGRYRLLAELGRGGMADVFLAMTAGPGGFSKLLVLKQLRVGDDPQMVSMFLDEARLAARVSHPNIVQTFEVVHENSRAFMVMEFLDGPSLSRVRRAAAKRNEPVPLAIELKVLIDSLLGLHYAHELRGYDGKALGVVHRDYTPQNVIITYNGDVKIVDFGIAKALDQQTQTSAGMFKGKLTYVPPEQLLGQPVDRRADVFAAGVMLYEAVTGQSPWKGLTNAAVSHALASGRIPRLMDSGDAPPELAAICDQAMAVDPDDRYATADELRFALEEFVRDHALQLERAQLGEYVVSMLGDARERTREVIDQQMKQLNNLPSADTLTQSLPTLDGLTPSPAAKVVGRSLPALMSSDAMPDTGQSQGATAPPSKRLGAAFIGLGVLIAALVAVVVYLVFRAPPQPVAAVVTPAAAAPPVAVPAAAPVAAPVPEPASAPAKVAVRIQASPATARVYLDDLELPGNPFLGAYPSDTVVHELRISAPGYVDVRRGVQFERDVTLDVTLARVPPPAPVRPGQKPPPAQVAQKPADPAKPPPPEAKPDDPEYFPPASSVKKQPKRSLDNNIEFH
jgi:serine/threonine-protein kinase